MEDKGLPVNCRENMNTCDKVATELFGVEKAFGFRFNHNMRWFWARSKTFYNFKIHLQNMPLDQAKIFTQIYLN